MIKDNLKDIDFIKDNLSDRLWRLQNLYHIKDKDGNKVVFKLNDVQKKLHESLWYRNVIPKARKTGVSTFFSILTLDQILFSENKTGGIIAHRQEDVKRIFVSLTTRGMTPQFLHVSEYGYICKNSPDKAEEIISGAMNSVALGNMVSFESTAMGRGGRFYEMCMQAEQARITGRQLTPLDFRIHFFPWWIDPQYALHDADFVTIPEDMMVYFRALKDKHGISLTLPQMRWYVKSYNTNGSIMKTEFPSCLSECFEVSLEGAYYASQVTAIYAENRIGFFPVEQSQPVHTAWDLGMDDATAIVFYQTLGHEIRIVDYYEASGVGLDEHVKELHKRGYRYGRHTLPHDVNVRELNTGSSRLEMLYSLGVHNIDVAPKLTRADGIEKVRLLLPRTTFDKGKTQKLLDSLQAYRKKWDDTKGGWSDTPAHGPESHGADATRYLATTYMESYNYTPDHGTVGISKDGVHIESVWK